MRIGLLLIFVVAVTATLAALFPRRAPPSSLIDEARLPAPLGGAAAGAVLLVVLIMFSRPRYFLANRWTWLWFIVVGGIGVFRYGPDSRESIGAVSR